MMYASTVGGRATAAPDRLGACPSCGEAVRAKCGQTVVWHWAHIAREDCDPWAERDNAWHWNWQQQAPDFRREVVIGKHRADIITSDGWVVEVQHSGLSADEIERRERHYDRMVWIFDAREAYESQRLDVRAPSHPDATYRTFRWRHPRKTVAACRRKVLLDLNGSTLLKLGRIHPQAPCGGWGNIVSAESVSTWIGTP